MLDSNNAIANMRGFYQPVVLRHLEILGHKALEIRD
jgi:hypothetical protein